ncbi:hypothetical protein DYU11_06070 [Fibrisoma montanum]|uniref:DUF4369 domain-containing protein n=1 Tax=Fibrisoma montanum TaxID=2305895 RepID=A0A418MDM3_9BACT|nr:hypothetical protein [Fibrisoma montanum]RIV24882.1 hypothetical protein DYU11_06070 [Fibrisoma montanum]
MKSGLLISGLLLLVAVQANAQQKKPQPQTIYIPQTVYQGPVIDYTYHDGVIRLRDGTTLKGRFQFNGRKTFIYRAGAQAPQQKFGFSSIRRLALVGADTLVTARTDSTIFVRMGTRLYRELASGPTMVMDQVYTVDEDRGKIGSRIYVLDDAGKFHRFSSLQKLNRWFYAYQEQVGQKAADVFLNKTEIARAVAQLNRQ